MTIFMYCVEGLSQVDQTNRIRAGELELKEREFEWAKGEAEKREKQKIWSRKLKTIRSVFAAAVQLGPVLGHVVAIISPSLLILLLGYVGFVARAASYISAAALLLLILVINALRQVGGNRLKS